MSDPHVPSAPEPIVGSQPVAPSDPGGPAPAPAPAPAQDELAVLDALEAHLAAVEQAISTLEQVAGDGIGGAQAAAQIAAAVSAERFGTGPASSEPTA